MRKNGVAAGFRYYGPETCRLMISDLGLRSGEDDVRSIQNTFIRLGKDPTVGEIYLADEAFALSRQNGTCRIGEIRSHSESVISLWHDFIKDMNFTSAPTLAAAAFAAAMCGDYSASRIYRTSFPEIGERSPAAVFSAGGFTLADYRCASSSVKEKATGSCRTVFRPVDESPASFSERMNILTGKLREMRVGFSVRAFSSRGFLRDLSDNFRGATVNLRNYPDLRYPEDAIHVLGSGAMFVLPAGSEPYFDSVCSENGILSSDIVRALSTQPVFGIIAEEDSVLTDFSTLDELYRGPEISLTAEIPEYETAEQLTVESPVMSDIRAFSLGGNIYGNLERTVSGKKWAVGGFLSADNPGTVPAIISLYEFVRNTGNPPVCADFSSGRSTSFTVFTS